MIELNSRTVVENIVQSRETYMENRFFGPYVDFTETIYDNQKTIIEFERFYSEDSKYANKKTLVLAVDAISELVENKFIILKLFGRELFVPKGADKFEIQELLLDFILNNVKLT